MKKQTEGTREYQMTTVEFNRIDGEWVQAQPEVIEVITQEHFLNYISKDTMAFFRDLGGKEYLTRKHGRTTLISSSPDGDNKIIRVFVAVEDLSNVE